MEARPTASASARGASTASIVILSVWLGAVAYFIAVVAPAAFRVLPERTLAGALIGQTLPTIFISGLVAGVLVAGLGLRAGRTTRQRATEFVGGVLVALLCGVAQFVIGHRIDRLLAAMGTAPDALPVGDPLRIAFGRLHTLSVLCLGLAALVALALLVVTLVTMRRDTQV